MERVMGRVQVWKVSSGKACLNSCVLSLGTDEFLSYKCLQTIMKVGGVSVHHFCYVFQYSFKNTIKIKLAELWCWKSNSGSMGNQLGQDTTLQIWSTIVDPETLLASYILFGLTYQNSLLPQFPYLKEQVKIIFDLECF